MRLIALAAALTLVPASAALAYPWPLQPFDQPHPVRSNFGDPRTRFLDTADTDGLYGRGTFSFHNGVDISATFGTPVYPVASGTAHLRGAGTVVVSSPGGTAFHYVHITPAVSDGQQVVAQTTVLGTVQKWAGHLHFGESRRGRLVNPLNPGHLQPYVDTTRPRVRNLDVRDQQGRSIGLVGLHGKVVLTVEAYDRPSVLPPPPFRDLPVAPARVGWSMATLDGRVVAPDAVPIDFTLGLPPNKRFWNVYARGTYQNNPRFNRQVFTGIPGRYIFRLTSGTLDTHRFANGIYKITAWASDTAGHTGTLVTRVAIRNPPPAP